VSGKLKLRCVALAAVAAMAAGCATETPYSLPQSLPSQGGYAQPSYGYGSGGYGYGSGYYYGPYGYSPGAYYADPLYYNAPYRTYYYPYPVIVRCPDKNSDGRCDKPVKQHDGNQGGGNVDLTKYRRDARGIVPQTRVPDAVKRTASVTPTQTVTQPAQRTQVMPAQEPRAAPAQPRNDRGSRSQNSAPPPARPANMPQPWPQQALWPQQHR